jgi:hypothetical protein
MSRCDLPRVVSAAREFIAVITRHAEQYDAPDYNKVSHLGCAKVVIAASAFHLALEGRTIFDPPTSPDDGRPRVFVGIEQMDAAIQLRIVRECLRRLLRRVGYLGEQVLGAAFGSMPSMKGLEDLPQVGLPELPDLILATDELEALTKTLTIPTTTDTKPVRKSEEKGRPTADMFKAFLAHENGARESAIAKELGVSQPTISRRINRVKDWKEAGNKVPGLDELPRSVPQRRAFSVDPRKMARYTEDDE